MSLEFSLLVDKWRHVAWNYTYTDYQPQGAPGGPPCKHWDPVMRGCAPSLPTLAATVFLTKKTNKLTVQVLPAGLDLLNNHGHCLLSHSLVTQDQGLVQKSSPDFCGKKVTQFCHLLVPQAAPTRWWLPGTNWWAVVEPTRFKGRPLTDAEDTLFTDEAALLGMESKGRYAGSPWTKVEAVLLGWPTEWTELWAFDWSENEKFCFLLLSENPPKWWSNC